MDFEIEIIKFLQSGRNNFYDVSFQAITMLGSVLAVVLFALFLFKFKHHLAVWYLVTYGFAALVIAIVKATVLRVRPFVASEDIVLIGKVSSDFSFPSGHTACAMAIAIFMGYFLFGHYKKAGARALIVICLSMYVGLVGLSRMYLGAHYLTDVLAGAAISAVICTSFILILRHLNKKLRGKDYEIKDANE